VGLSASPRELQQEVPSLSPHTHTRVHTRAGTHRHRHARARVRVHVCMSTRVHTHRHTYTCVHTNNCAEDPPSLLSRDSTQISADAPVLGPLTLHTDAGHLPREKLLQRSGRKPRGLCPGANECHLLARRPATLRPCSGQAGWRGSREPGLHVGLGKGRRGPLRASRALGTRRPVVMSEVPARGHSTIAGGRGPQGRGRLPGQAPLGRLSGLEAEVGPEHAVRREA